MPSSRTRVSLVVAAACAALSLPACSTLVGAGGPVPDIFDISAPTEFEASARTGAQLLVPPPVAIGALATNRIAVRPDPSRIAYYPGGVWSDELPALVQLKLIHAFENSGLAKAVGRPGESLAIDYQVLVDLRAFEIDVVGGDTAHVALGVKLLDDRTGLVRASRIFVVRLPAPGADTPEGAVAALDAATDRAMSEVVAWTAATL